MFEINCPFCGGTAISDTVDSKEEVDGEWECENGHQFVLKYENTLSNTKEKGRLASHKKIRFFRAIDKYIEAKIELQTSYTRSSFYETEPGKSKVKYEKAKNELVEYIKRM